MTPVRHQQIAQTASKLWQEADCPPGRDLEFWLKAERTLNLPATAPDVSRNAETHEDFSEQVEDLLAEFGVRTGPRSATSL